MRSRDLLKREQNEQAQLKSAISESKFIEAMWQHRYSEAADILDPHIDPVAEGDSKLAGWLNFWAGAARGLAGTNDAASEHYRIAKSRLPLHMDLPVEPVEQEYDAAAAACSAEAALQALVYARTRTFNNQITQATTGATLITSASSTPAGCEEAYRSLGAFLGYASSRPDEETGAGPDVLWIDEQNALALSFELKTDKAKGSVLSKREVGQSHNHTQWMADNYPKVRLTRHFMVGHSLGVAPNANPDPSWKHNEPEDLLTLVQSFIAESQRIRRLSQDGRLAALAAISGSGSWNTAEIDRRLSSRPISD